MRVLGASDSLPGKICIWTGYIVRGGPNPFKEESCKMVAPKMTSGSRDRERKG